MGISLLGALILDKLLTRARKMKGTKYFLMFALLGVSFWIITNEAIALERLSSDTAIGQCGVGNLIDVLGLDNWQLKGGKKGDGNIEQFVHQLLQKIIDIWFALVMMVIEFVCSLFESLGFRCG